MQLIGLLNEKFMFCLTALIEINQQKKLPIKGGIKINSKNKTIKIGDDTILLLRKKSNNVLFVSLKLKLMWEDNFSSVK